MNEILGTASDDILIGTDQDDNIFGLAGNDNINGGAGNDTISGGGGSDIIAGGAGDDVINGDKASDILIGGAGNDILSGAGGGDTLNGTDSVAAGAGEIDELTGSTQEDADLFILGDDERAYYIETGNTDYTVINDFQADLDVIQLHGFPEDYSLTQVDADTHLLLNGELVAILKNIVALDLDLSAQYFSYVGTGGITIIGNETNETLEGTEGFDNIQGSGGNDTITGSGGIDNLAGNNGNDNIDGGAGNDFITGDDGNDNIDGNDGNDIINGGIGHDTISGGAGNDTISGAGDNDSIDGGDGDDIINGDKGSDILIGSGGNDILSGAGGGDTLNGTNGIAAGAGEIDNLTGSIQADADLFLLGDEEQAYYVAAGSNDYAIINDFQVNFDVIQLNGFPEEHSLVQVDTDTHLFQNGELVAILKNITASDLDLSAQYFSYVGTGVTIIGDASNETLEGTEGFDNIQGGGGNDNITGGAGIDNLAGNQGDDTIDGGADNDFITGEQGNDLINGNIGDDNIDGGANDDIVEGGEGNDTINGDGGNDTINGGMGDDVINGDKGIDILNGGAGNDILSGAGGSDILNGTDEISAGAGEIDELTGSIQEDADLFILGDEERAYYIAAEDNDYAIINDFQLLQDTIQLNGSAQQYSLSQINGDIELSQNAELIAVLKGLELSTMDLSAPYFQYVGIVEENTPPIAQNDEMGTEEDTTLTIAASTLLANDSDLNLDDILQITEVNNAVNGTVSLDESGQVMFIPTANFSGEASFDYVISDGAANSSATVIIDVTSVNDAPTTSGIEGFTVTNNAPDSIINLFDVFEDVEDADADLMYAIAESTNTDLFSTIGINSSTGELSLDYADGAEGVAELIIQATDSSGVTTTTEFTVSILNAKFWNNYLSGSGGDDYLQGKFGRDKIFGQAGDDTIEGNWGRDSLWGDDGHDIIFGGFGSDSLSGGADNDRLNGAGNYSVGFLERDILAGGEGADVFILGNEHKSYYKGGYRFDYALIKDFNDREDTVLLHGHADDYVTYGSKDKTYLYAMNSSSSYFSKDLVAVFENLDGIELQSSSVQFLNL